MRINTQGNFDGTSNQAMIQEHGTFVGSKLLGNMVKVSLVSGIASAIFLTFDLPEKWGLTLVAVCVSVFTLAIYAKIQAQTHTLERDATLNFCTVDKD